MEWNAMQCTHKCMDRKKKKIIEIQRESIHQLMFAFPPFFRRTKFSVIAADVVPIAVAAFFFLSHFIRFGSAFFFLISSCSGPLAHSRQLLEIAIEVDLFLFAVFVFVCVCVCAVLCCAVLVAIRRFKASVYLFVFSLVVQCMVCAHLGLFYSSIRF